MILLNFLIMFDIIAIYRDIDKFIHWFIMLHFYLF